MPEKWACKIVAELKDISHSHLVVACRLGEFGLGEAIQTVKQLDNAVMMPAQKTKIIHACVEQGKHGASFILKLV